jgi:hypothetical protein
MLAEGLAEKQLTPMTIATITGTKSASLAIRLSLSIDNPAVIHKTVAELI